MRITEFLASSTFRRQIRTNRADMVTYNNQVATGKRVEKASDDTGAFLSGKLIEDYIRKNEQYQKNVNTGLFQARRVQETLDQMNDLMTSMKTLLVSASNDTNNVDERAIIASEIEAIRDELVGLANVKFNDVYLFAGTNSSQEPFFEDIAEPGGIGTSSSTDPLKVLVGSGSTVETTVSGTDLRDTGSGDLFEIIQDTVDALNANDGAAIQNSIDGIDESISHVIDLSTTIGNNINRLDHTHERLEYNILGEKAEVSRLTDADIVEAMLNFQNAQTSYQSVLAAQSRMLQTSLLNFLR